MGADWISDQLARLNIKETRANTLNEIHELLRGLPTLEVVVIQKLLNAPELYSVLCEPDDSESVEIAVEILALCLSQISLDQNDADTLIRRAMQNERLRVIALNAIVKELRLDLKDYEKMPYISDELVQILIEALQNNNTHIGVPALRALSVALMQRLEQEQIKQQLYALLECNETIRLRVYEIAVNVAKVNNLALEQVAPLLDSAVRELQSDDVLLQMNVMELLISLGEVQDGFEFLNSHGVFRKLNERVEQLAQNPLDQLLVPSIMKFFGKIAYVYPEQILTVYPHLLLCLFDCLRSPDPAVLGTVFDTFANVCYSKHGKELLANNYNDHVKDILEKFIYELRNLSSDLKVRGFLTLKNIFAWNGEENEIVHSWFNYLSNNSQNLQFMLDYIQNPFADIKVSCLGFVQHICHYQWGLNALRNSAGLVEYLLNRKLEFDKDAKLAKFEIIAVLEKSHAFENSTQQQLHTFVRQGPYYVEPALDIATEGGGSSS